VGVRVVRVGSIPFGLSALIDEQPGSLVVWLLEGDWPEPLARLIEQIMNVMWALRSHAALSVQPGLYVV